MDRPERLLDGTNDGHFANQRLSLSLSLFLRDWFTETWRASSWRRSVCPSVQDRAFESEGSLLCSSFARIAGTARAALSAASSFFKSQADTTRLEP